MLIAREVSDRDEELTLVAELNFVVYIVVEAVVDVVTVVESPDIVEAKCVMTLTGPWPRVNTCVELVQSQGLDP